MNENKKNKSGFAFGFFLGGLLGAFLIFLLGTKEGKKLARKMTDQAELFEEEIEKKVSSLQEKGENLLAEAQTIKDKMKTELQDNKRNVTHQLMDKLGTALDKAEKAQEKGIALTQEVKKKYFKKDGKTLTS